MPSEPCPEQPAEADRPEGPEPPLPAAREILTWLAVGLLVAVVTSWPLVLRLGRSVPQDTADPLLQAWQLAWVGHAVTHHPWSVFGANAFYPSGPSLAFSDSLLGYAPLSVFGWGVDAAVVRYNVIFLLAEALAFTGAAVLARELRCPRPAAAAAGAVFAYAPWHLSQLGHLNVLSVGGIPLALALLIGGYRHARPTRVLAGWLVAIWQISLGFAMGIYFGYLLLLLAAVVLIAWWRRGFPAPGRSMIAASVGGAATLAYCGAFLVRPYFTVRARYPESHRDLSLIELFAAPPKGLLVAPENSRFWGEVTKSARQTLVWIPEQTLFPGILAVLLAVAGLTVGRVNWRLRALLAGSVVLAAVISVQPHPGRLERLYRLAYELLPGISALRAPGRFTVFMLLPLGLLAALGVERVLRSARPAPMTRGMIAGLLVAGIVAEGLSGKFPLAEVPKAPPGLAVVPGPRFHLPSDSLTDPRYMLWSVDGWPQVANGYSGVLPPELAYLRQRLEAFPSAESVAALRAAGFQSVVVHPDMLPNTPYAATLSRPTYGLGIARSDRAGYVVFDLDP